MAQRPTPHEYAARVILPALRGLVAHVMAGRGYGQYSIARLLGVSQPMVHRYLERGVEYYLSQLEAEGVDRGVALEAAEAAARALAAGDHSLFWLVVNELALQGRLCRGEPGCEGVLCPGPGILSTARYEEALRRLLSIECLERLIPEVGGNLAYSPRPPEPPESIIALDGRIVKTASGVRPAGRPRRGGSRHTARVLSEYSASNPRLRWALALSPTSGLLEALRARGAPVVRMGEEAPPAGVLGVLEEAAPGREAVLYLLAANEGDLESIVREAARRECGRS